MMLLSEARCKEIKEEMKNDPVIYSWGVVTCLGGDGFRLGRNLASLVVPVVFFSIYLISYFSHSDNGVVSDFSFLILGCLFYLFFRYGVLSDRCYEFYLTKRGIYSSSYQMIPESSYLVIRIIAGIGALISLVAMVVIGPLAFIGTGAFVILSFTKMDFSKRKETRESIFQKKMMLFNFKYNNRLCLESFPYYRYAKLDIFCKEEEKK